MKPKPPAWWLTQTTCFQSKRQRAKPWTWVSSRMPSITGDLDKRRILIDVGVQPSRPVVEGVSPSQFAPPMVVNTLRGLIDTGAQRTCITRSAAARIGLRPRGKIPMGNVSSIEMHNRYRFVLTAWYDDPTGRGWYMFDTVEGADFKDNEDFDVLIGMDVIGQGDLTITRVSTFIWQLP
ncbi:MAG TPA: aspartyl protease family protein [Sphingomicrobium sp.]